MYLPHISYTILKNYMMAHYIQKPIDDLVNILPCSTNESLKRINLLEKQDSSKFTAIFSDN